jgi:hypothetical protein
MPRARRNRQPRRRLVGGHACSCPSRSSGRSAARPSPHRRARSSSDGPSSPARTRLQDVVGERLTTRVEHGAVAGLEGGRQDAHLLSRSGGHAGDDLVQDLTGPGQPPGCGRGPRLRGERVARDQGGERESDGGNRSSSVLLLERGGEGRAKHSSEVGWRVRWRGSGSAVVKMLPPPTGADLDSPFDGIASGFARAVGEMVSK